MSDKDPVVEPAIDILSGEGYSTVVISGKTIASFRCSHMAEHLAKKLAEARARPHRESIHYLITELGSCEQTAQWVYSLFFGKPSPTRH